MNDNSKIDRHTASVRRTGLLIALAAFLVLLVLAAYRLPLFHKEFYGTIVGVSETHNEAGSELVAAVQLETGDQVLVYLPRELLKNKSNDVRINEGQTLFGRKYYRIIIYDD